MVWRIAIENLRNMTKTSFGQMTRENVKPLPNLILNLLSVTVHFEIRVDKRPEQPCPDRSLVIRAVSRNRITFVVSTIPGVRRGQTPETVRRKQVSFDSVHDSFRAPFTQHRMR